MIVCCCTCHRHTLVFGIQKAWPPPIRVHKLDGLPEAPVAELLVTKQDLNSLIGSGKSPTNLEAMSLNY